MLNGWEWGNDGKPLVIHIYNITHKLYSYLHSHPIPLLQPIVPYQVLITGKFSRENPWGIRETQKTPMALTNQPATGFQQWKGHDDARYKPFIWQEMLFQPSPTQLFNVGIAIVNHPPTYHRFHKWVLWTIKNCGGLLLSYTQLFTIIVLADLILHWFAEILPRVGEESPFLISC